MEEKNTQIVSQSLEEETKKVFRKFRESVMNQKTPKEYIGDKFGQAFVSYPYMDDAFKTHFPAYEFHFAFPPIMFQNFILVGVELKDKVTGNVELGLKAHRIQIKKDKKDAIENGRMTMADLTPFDVIDFGNDSAAALTDAIKNAESRFGICADVYRKIVYSKEELDTLNSRFNTVIEKIEQPLLKRKIIENWNALKGNKEEFLNKLESDNL